MLEKILKTIVFITVLACLSGCGGNEELSCDEVRRYQLAVEGRRIETPDDLNDLEPLREMPLPKANPRPERPPGSPCLDLPPSVLTGGK